MVKIVYINIITIKNNYQNFLGDFRTYKVSLC